MTDSEICREYRQAKDKAGQIQILADLEQTDRWHIIDTLLRGGERVQIIPHSCGRRSVRQLSDDEYREIAFERLDVLDKKIAGAEREYCLIVRSLLREG